MLRKNRILLMCLCLIGFIPLAAEEIPNPSSPDMQSKISDFLNQEGKNISSTCPFRINLYKQGTTDQNSAGLRISETAQLFGGILTEQLFFYKLYDHSQRVPHWHANAVEMGLVLNGRMKITIWDGPGNANVFVVDQGSTWFIPQASVHCLENASDVELDFLVTYNSGNAADRDFTTAWAALPSTLLEKSLGLSSEDISLLKKTTLNRLSSADPQLLPKAGDNIFSPYSAVMDQIDYIYKGPLGSIKRVDETNWPAMKYMALQHTTLKPGTIREPHWYTTGDVVLFIYGGKAFFTMMDSEGKAYNLILDEGDMVFLPVGTFHTFVNIGTEDLDVYETFKSSAPLGEIGILDASQHFEASTLAGASGLSKETIGKILKRKRHLYMTSL